MKKKILTGLALACLSSVAYAADPGFFFPGGARQDSIIHAPNTSLDGKTVTEWGAAIDANKASAAAAQATANSAASGVTANAAAIATETERAKAAETDNATTAGAAIPKKWIGANTTSSVTGVAPLDSSGNMPSPVAGSVTQATAQASNGLTTATLATRFSRVLDVVNDGGAKCDGATDDSTAISSLLTKAAGNAIVRIPTGLTCRAKSIIVPAYSHLTIDGTLKAIDAADAQLITINTRSYVTIDGIGTIDGDRGSYPSTDTGVYACINANGTSYFVLQGVTVQNCKNFPVNIWNHAAHAYVSHVKLLNSGNSPECAAYVDDCWIDHSYISGITDVGWSFYNSVTNSGATNNRSTLNTGAGFTSYQDGKPDSTNSNIIFANNIADHNGGPGFVDNGIETSGSTSRHKNISFIGNIGSYNNTHGQTGYGCITVTSGYYYTIVGNQCSYDGANGATVYGIWAIGQVYNATISDNIIFNEGQGGALGTGIWISATSYYLNIHDNLIFDDQATHTMAFGIAGHSSADSGVQIHHNKYRSLLGGNGLTNYKSANDTIIDEQIIQRVSASGSAISISSYATWLYLYQTFTIASQSITLPPYSGNGQILTISSLGSITSLTVTASSGSSVIGAPTTLAAGSSVSFRYDGPSATWVRI